jgi:hypothetical protein
MKTKKAQSRSRRTSDEKITLLDTPTGAAFKNKPMPLEAELVADAKFRRERWVALAEHARTVLAPLHKIIAADPYAQKALKSFRPKPRPKLIRKKTFVPKVRSHVRSGSIWTFRGLPYDFFWQPNSGSSGFNSGGSEAFKDSGEFFIHNEVKNPSAYVWAGAGVAVWFRPVSESGVVNFRSYTPGTYSWDDDSFGYAADSGGFIGILIESWNLQGQDHRVDQDNRFQQWSDGTGWWQEHGFNSEEYVLFPNDTWFFSTRDRWYRIWLWAWAWNAAEGQGLFGSTSEARMHFTSAFCTFNEITIIF